MPIIRYDFDNDNKISRDDVLLLLSRIPDTTQSSTTNHEEEKGYLSNKSPEDRYDKELKLLAETVFKENEYLTFEMFKEACEKYTSEIFLSVYH